MPDIDISEEIKTITSRDKMIRFLDGYSAERMEELDERAIYQQILEVRQNEKTKI
jgi:hypothetical protein